MKRCWRDAAAELPNVNKTSENYEREVVIAYDGHKTRALFYERREFGGADVYRWLWIWDAPYDGFPVIAWRPIPEYDPGE